MASLHETIPTEFRDNIAWRVALRQRCVTDELFRTAVLEACRHDILFWMKAFCWVYEPRPHYQGNVLLPKQLPFLPWPHQIPVITTLREKLGHCDIGIEKARGEGMSWIMVMLAMHDWLFDPGAKVGIVSRTEDEADDPDNSDSIFWKIDWLLSKFPVWMAGVKGKDWNRNRTKHSLVNYRSDSQINADATSGNVFRGGRLKWVALDEFAFFRNSEDKEAMSSSSGATYSRLFISTVNGMDNEYYHVMHEESNMVKLVMDWRDNPIRNRGLYQMVKGVPVAVDPLNNPLPANYNPPTRHILDVFSSLRRKGFVLEGKTRSPWYDHECDRTRNTPQRIAQELERDYGGSKHHVFTAEFFTRASATIRDPMIRGMMSYHPETLKPEFEAEPAGEFLLWVKLDVRNRPPERSYIVCADLSTGLGGSYTSNSVLHVIDATAMEQVGEFACNTMEPADFADLCIATAKLFHDAKLAWEHNGPGTAFTARVKKRGYQNVFMRRILWKKGRRTKATKEMGWWTSPDSKNVMFSEFRQAVRSSEFVLRSKKTMEECHEYIYVNGLIEHEKLASTDDESSKGKSHGDRVIAMCVGIMAAKEQPHGKELVADELHENPIPGTLSERIRMMEEQEQEPDIWDGRTNDDLAAGTMGRAIGSGRGPSW